MTLYAGNGNLVGTSRRTRELTQPWIETIQKHPGESTKLIAGGLLALYGLSRRSWTGLALAAVGATLAYQASRRICLPPTCGDRFQDERLPSHLEHNRVDEASWESFPASDAPAMY